MAGQVSHVLSWVLSDFYSHRWNMCYILKLFLEYGLTFQTRRQLLLLGFAFFYPKMAFMYQHKEVCVLSRCSWYIDSLFLEQQAFCFAQLMLYVPVRGDVWIYCSLVVWPAMYDLLPKCLKGFILYSLLLVLSNFFGGSWHSCYETVHHDLYIFSDILFCLALC